MENPFFSLITICKNSSNQIHACLNSVYEQSFENYEHIVFDGKSTDNTLEIIQKLKSNKTKVYSNADRGIYDALNNAIHRCKGEYIILVHSDDVLHNKNVLEELHKEIVLKKYLPIYIANIVYVNKNGKVVRSWKAEIPTLKKLRMGWMAPHTGLVLKKEIFNKIGFYDINYKISADYGFELKLFKSYINKVSVIDITLIKMKIGGISNKNLKSLFTKTIEDLHIMKNNNIKPLIGIFFKNFSKLNQLFGDF